MTTKNGDMPAMPIVLKDGEVWSEDFDYANGLTKREMIAMHMMAANRSRQSSYRSWEAMATDAVEAADALLAELERTNGN